MKIIDLSYFVNEREIPNLSDNATLVSNNAKLEQLVDKYEFEFIFMALGFTLGNEFIEALELESLPEKWEKFLNGDGTWKGLKKTYGTYKNSLIADYVYCSWMYDNEVDATAKGGDFKHSNWDLIVRAWQSFYVWYYEMFEYIKDWEGLEFTPIDNINSMQL